MTTDRTDPLTRFDYQLLGRLQMDCEYFLGNGNRAVKHLWAGNETDQIAKMRELYEKLPEKPQWLTSVKIDEYEAKMIPQPEVVQARRASPRP